MTVEIPQRLLDAIPDPVLLVGTDGIIVAVNQRLSSQLAGIAPVGMRLSQHATSKIGTIDALLNSYTRTSSPMPGSLTFNGMAEHPFRCYGSLVIPPSDGSPGQILLRLVSKQESLHQFQSLNEKFADLKEEVRRRQQMEADLRQQHEELETTLASIGDAVIVTDAQGCVRMLNPVAEALTGWSRMDAVKRPLSSILRIVNEFTRQPVENPVEKVLRSGAIVGLANHTILIARDGTELPIDDSAAPIRGLQGEVTGVVLVFRDVTDLRAQERIRGRLAAIVESSDDAILSKSLEGIITSWNAGAERLYGYTAEEAVGQPFSILMPYDHTEEAQEIQRLFQRGERLDHFESVRRRKDGSLVTVSVTYSPLRDVEGQLTGVSVIARDITEQKQEREARKQAEMRLQLLTNALPALISYVDRDHRYRFINQEYTKWFGQPREMMEGRTLLEVLGEEAYRAVTPYLESVFSGQDVTYEMRVPYLHGGHRDVRATYVPHRGPDGEVQGFFSLVTDISQRKQAERTSRFLADASAALAAVVDYQSTLQMIAGLAVPSFADWCSVDIVNASGSLQRVAVRHADPEKVELANELHRKYPPDLNADHGLGKIIRSGQSELISEITPEMIAATQSVPEMRDALLELGLKSYIGVPLKSRSRVMGVLTFILAESDRRYGKEDLEVAEDLARRAGVAIENAELYQTLRDADRRKDEFLAMLAHELRNPLAPVRTGLELLKVDGVEHDSIDVMREQVDHLVRLVDDLLDVSRIMRGKIQLRKESVNLTGVAQRAIETVRPFIESQRHRLTVSTPAHPVWIDADPVRMAQIILNLLNNAAKYTPQGGQIWLTITDDGQYARLSVRDNGVGLDEDLLPRVFDLFTQADRSLERAEGGLGIGLTLVKTLVELHEGQVFAHSDGAEQGSEFAVQLPLKHQPQLNQKTMTARQTTAKRRILLVDDNVGTTKIQSMLLSKLGDHEVRVAHDGQAALQMAEEYRPEIIFLDIGLPHMNGFEVAQELRGKTDFRQTLLVALTGYGTSEDRRKTQEAGFDVHLVKPPSIDEFRDVLSHSKLDSPLNDGDNA